MGSDATVRVTSATGHFDRDHSVSIALVCIGVIVLPASMRGLIFGEVGSAVNVLAWLGILRLFMSGNVKRTIMTQRVQPVLLATFMTLFLMIGASEINEHLLLDIWAYIPPLFLIYCSVETDLNVTTEELLSMWCKFLNIAVILILTCGGIDMISNLSASRFFAEFYGVRSYFGLLSEGRSVTFYGHALVTATIVMAAFCSNFMLGVLRNKKIAWGFLLLYIAAMASTTSKSGIVLLLLAIVITSVKAGYRRNILLVLVALAATYMFGLLDAVILRFIEGYRSGDVTTGRNDSLRALIGSANMTFHLFQGHEFDNSNIQLIAALEYPLLRFAYKYGIVFAFMFAVGFFGFPLMKLLASRRYPVLSIWLMFAVSVNTYSGIATYSDILLIYSITTMLLMAIPGTSEVSE